MPVVLLPGFLIPFSAEAEDFVKAVGNFLNITKACMAYPDNSHNHRKTENIFIRKNSILSINMVKGSVTVMPEGKKLSTVYIGTTEMRDEGYNSVSKHYEFNFQNLDEAVIFCNQLAKLSSK